MPKGVVHLPHSFTRLGGGLVGAVSPTHRLCVWPGVGANGPEKCNSPPMVAGRLLQTTVSGGKSVGAYDYGIILPVVQTKGKP